MPVPSKKADREVLTIFATLTSVFAFLFAAIGIAVVSTRSGGSSGSGDVAAAAAPVAVTLSEYKVSPAVIKVAAGEVTLSIKNSGSQVHNFAVDKFAKTKDIAAGETVLLNLGAIPEGTHKVTCEVVGHTQNGMVATLVVGPPGSAPSSGEVGDMAGMDHSSGEIDYAAMDTRMEAGMKAGLETFTKGNSTKGVGNQPLQPTVEPDGTKVFTIESAITDWEVSPGKTVKAWTYNGQVPGPWIRTEPNDKVKVVIKNSLPVSTDIHFHGISTPFEQDGVAPLTQDYIRPGTTYTYQWTNATHPELGMYHAHDHGNIAVLNGMFAVFQVGDVKLPAGRTVGGTTLPASIQPTQEFPMVLNDAGTIGLSLNGKSFPATAPVSAKPGDTLLVHYYNEGLAAHPMHLHRVPQLVVAKDGFSLDQPYWVDTLNIAPGERYSVLIMPGPTDVGVWAWHCHILTHAENDDGLFGMVTALLVDDPTP